MAGLFTPNFINGGDMKSHVSIMTEVVKTLIYDVFTACAVDINLRDADYLVSRVEHEGLSFLTITLPDFGKDFEKCLERGRVDSTDFRAFRKTGLIPAFLQGITSLVFDKHNGGIKDEIDPILIRGVRQIAYAFKKVKLDCTEQRISRAIGNFVSDDADLQCPRSEQLVDNFRRISRAIWHETIAGINPLETLPKHGPGATADRMNGNKKFIFKQWHKRLENSFPLIGNCFHNENCLESEEFESLRLVDQDDEQPVRVVFVPKTLKTPRIIAIEPVAMQYAQQSISRALVSVLETCSLTKGHINFSDQSVNQELARSSSVTRRYSTIDLSSASDRVPLSLALIMFEGNDGLINAITSSRSLNAKLPDGKIVHLSKFASMGSALCFPVESMYFYTLCIMALLDIRALRCTSQNIHKVSRDVFIYGDDIIVPSDETAGVIDHMQKYYCKVNTTKSFWNGKFRESCGADYYDGVSVTPTYIRSIPPDDIQTVHELVSWVETGNLLYLSGYWRTSRLVHNYCERILGPLPVVSPKSSCLGKVSFQRFLTAERMSKRYHRPELRGWVVCPVYRKDKLDGYFALNKCLLLMQNRKSCEDVDEQHLSRSVRRGAVALKRRWVSVF